MQSENFDRFAHDPQFRQAIKLLKSRVEASAGAKKSASEDAQLLAFAKNARKLDLRKFRDDPKFKDALKKLGARVKKLNAYEEPKVVHAGNGARAQRAKSTDVSNLPYMHRNPAV